MPPTFHEIDPKGDTLLILRNANAPIAVHAWDESMKLWREAKSAPAGIPEVRMRLSSKHLTLASRYFQKMTESNWKETTPEDGYAFTATAEEWDEQALLILMNIIHGRTAKVPWTIDLDMFAKMAILVDYYECHEAVEFFVRTWKSEIGSGVPMLFSSRDRLLRLFVSWVFPAPEDFRGLTKSIISTNIGPFNPLGVPIPQNIIDAINKRREDDIFEILSDVHRLKIQLLEDETTCSFECSSICLGALSKGMNKIGILDPRPARPFPNMALSILEMSLRSIKDPVWSDDCPAASGGTTTTTAPGGLFGTTSAKPAPAPAGGLFGTTAAKPAPAPTGGLFGATPAKPSPFSAGGLFSTPAKPSPSPAPTGGLFGATPAKPSPAPTGGLFGTIPAKPSPAPAGGLFGATPAKPSPAPTGGFFGATPATKPSPSPAPTGGLFGTPATKPAPAPAPTGNPFGTPATSNTTANTDTKPIKRGTNCSISAKIRRILDKQLTKREGLDLNDFLVNKGEASSVIGSAEAV